MSREVLVMISQHLSERARALAGACELHIRAYADDPYPPFLDCALSASRKAELHEEWADAAWRAYWKPSTEVVDAS